MKSLQKSIPLLLLCILSSVPLCQAQSFPEKCLGVWEGMMYIQTENYVKDSVWVEFSVTKTEQKDRFGWKTEYISEKYPITKDYELVVKDEEKGLYLLDEKDGIVLKEYQFGNKLYSTFEVQGNHLHSTYELTDDALIFEISFGKKMDTTNQVSNFSVSNLQRVVLKRKN